MGRTTEGGRNIFEAAATFGYRGVRYFVENKGVPVTSTDDDNRTAAHIAAREGKVNVVRYLLGKNGSLLNATDKFGHTMYHLSVMSGALNVVEFLINERRVDVYETNKIYDGNTAVHLAAESGQLKVLRYLIEKQNCDINVLNARGQPPVFLAAGKRRAKIIKYVAEVLTNFVGLTATDFSNKTILFMCAMTGDTSIPTLLLTKYKLHIDVNQRDDTGATAVFWASRLGHFDFLKYIISWKHANVNLANNEGRTPLHEAVGEGYVFVTKYLIEQGANKTALDKNGMTPADCTTDENVLVCFRRVSRKGRVRRNVPYAAIQFTQSTTRTPLLGSPTSPTLSTQLASLDHRCVCHSGTVTLSRVEGVITLLSGLAIYFAGQQHSDTSGCPPSAETMLQSKIDLHAADAAIAASDFTD